jgi:Cu(I)/Ag(I) efflux system membrane protein CusA/SilA
VWLLYALGYHMSIAVWVGMIALIGLDAETGIFMLLYLDLAYDERGRRRDARAARTWRRRSCTARSSASGRRS